MEAYIVAGYRSAVGKAKKGGFRFYRSDDLAVRVLEHLGKNVDFDTNLIDDVLVGCANPEGEQGKLAVKFLCAPLAKQYQA